MPSPCVYPFTCKAVIIDQPFQVRQLGHIGALAKSVEIVKNRFNIGSRTPVSLRFSDRVLQPALRSRVTSQRFD